jgi:hypothetical protein
MCPTPRGFLNCSTSPRRILISVCVTFTIPVRTPYIPVSNLFFFCNWHSLFHRLLLLWFFLCSTPPHMFEAVQTLQNAIVISIFFFYSVAHSLSLFLFQIWQQVMRFFLFVRFLVRHSNRLLLPVMSQSLTGIKKKRRLTGNQRQKLRESQAAIEGISADELLKHRHSRMAEWQKEQAQFSCLRCPNCGIFGHSFKWCPFSHDFHLQKGSVLRFRGPFGSWGSEPQIELTSNEKQTFRNFFCLLSMSLGSKSQHT